MTTLTMPSSPGFTDCRFGLETNTRRFESPQNRAVQRVALQGSRWTALYTLPPMNRAQAAPWQAFLLALKGGVNTFYGYDPDAKTPRGAYGGTPLVKGAGQTGSSLLLDGGTPSVTGWGKAGDYIGIGSQMVMLTQDADTDGSGEVTINFEPMLRDSPADNLTITTSNVTCTMALSDDSQSTWSTGSMLGVYKPISFTAIEVFS